LLFAVAVAGCCAADSATAQVYPSRPITMVVPFPAGGSTDTIGRVLADGMRASLGQTIIIENVGGGLRQYRRRPGRARGARRLHAHPRQLADACAQRRHLLPAVRSAQ